MRCFSTTANYTGMCSTCRRDYILRPGWKPGLNQFYIVHIVCVYTCDLSFTKSGRVRRISSTNPRLRVASCFFSPPPLPKRVEYHILLYSVLLISNVSYTLYSSEGKVCLKAITFLFSHAIREEKKQVGVEKSAEVNSRETFIKSGSPCSIIIPVVVAVINSDYKSIILLLHSFIRASFIRGFSNSVREKRASERINAQVATSGDGDSRRAVFPGKMIYDREFDKKKVLYRHWEKRTFIAKDYGTL